MIAIKTKVDSVGVAPLANAYWNQYGTQTLINPHTLDEIYTETQAKSLQVDGLVNDTGLGDYRQFTKESGCWLPS
ncbi:hypothetical protein GO755_25400 [Spirosoma sp. HMF4905]|uniref:Uncharacterized protein n=1 Tax=Spirosoma arboris TaxID=2682092 RepID=A0A7K1SHV4_9BACT|nr:hypothetical protein [Spirosoma arboris]MVM33400.1 hypothetical protein [Spirosoma arboris]